MPRKPKTKRVNKRGRVLRTLEEVQRLLKEIAAARSAGSTLKDAVKELKIPYNTYFKWARKHGTSASTVARAKAKAKAKAKGGRTEEEVRKILGYIAELRKGGVTVKEAVKRVQVPASSFHYWMRRFGKTAAAARVKKTGAKGAKKQSTLNILQAMVEHRKKRAELEQVEKQICKLDTEFKGIQDQLAAQSAG